MTIQREQLDSLRKQYPIGSRIELVEMTDDPQPIEPGTRGTLLYIDDGAILHIKWDNGRGLGLVAGKDIFNVLPPEHDQTQKADPQSHVKPHLRRKTGHSGQER